MRCFSKSPVMVQQTWTRGLKVDVVVAGGGMVGSAAAAGLAQLGEARREEDGEN